MSEHKGFLGYTRCIGGAWLGSVCFEMQTVRAAPNGFAVWHLDGRDIPLGIPRPKPFPRRLSAILYSRDFRRLILLMVYSLPENEVLVEM